MNSDPRMRPVKLALQQMLLTTGKQMDKRFDNDQRALLTSASNDNDEGEGQEMQSVDEDDDESDGPIEVQAGVLVKRISDNINSIVGFPPRYRAYNEKILSDDNKELANVNDMLCRAYDFAIKDIKTITKFQQQLRASNRIPATIRQFADTWLTKLDPDYETATGDTPKQDRRGKSDRTEAVDTPEKCSKRKVGNNGLADDVWTERPRKTRYKDSSYSNSYIQDNGEGSSRLN